MRAGRVIALGVAAIVVWAAAALVIGGPSSLGRLREWMSGDAGQVAQEIAAKARAAGGALDPVEVSGSEVRLLGGRLDLVVRDERRRKDRSGQAHVHVLARLDGGPARGLDACIFGTGSTRQEAMTEAAEVFVGWALPPIAGLVGERGRAAARFGGTDAWGVPGVRGFVGPPLLRGPGVDEETAAALASAPMFAGLRSLPVDGRTHLLKAVLVTRDGTWRRTLELDGSATSISDEAWSGAAVPAQFASVVRFATFRNRDALADDTARVEALRRLDAGPRWLPAVDECPAELLPEALVEAPFVEGLCRGGRLLDCLEECEQGSGPSCYAAANETQTPGHPTPGPWSLFLRSCRLGIASGCTNAAATLQLAADRSKPARRAQPCAFRTFEVICERAGDPWACAMLGGSLANGEGAPRDPARAREVLGRSCRYGREDPACVAAEATLRLLDEGSRRAAP